MHNAVTPKASCGGRRVWSVFCDEFEDVTWGRYASAYRRSKFSELGNEEDSPSESQGKSIHHSFWNCCVGLMLLG